MPPVRLTVPRVVSLQEKLTSLEEGTQSCQEGQEQGEPQAQFLSFSKVDFIQGTTEAGKNLGCLGLVFPLQFLSNLARVLDTL